MGRQAEMMPTLGSTPVQIKTLVRLYVGSAWFGKTSLTIRTMETAQTLGMEGRCQQVCHGQRKPKKNID